ncbi:uncharacterized protein TNCV_3183031 [Trichonephila clavipes]|uniref:Uncharacterized protein n=1 Tax=Trichonephila clavipes TaxID=2585209 RepID=A0A8X6VM39_TRICX|nr:uncharacterized protein TNCV_3183031 [Trichonephila clavipes]
MFDPNDFPSSELKEFLYKLDLPGQNGGKTKGAQTDITRVSGVTSKRYLRLGDFNDFKFGNCVFLVVFSKNDQLCLRKQRSAFDQVSEFDRGRIVVYRDCGLSFKEMGSRVGRNQTTVMRICDLECKRVRRTDEVDHIHLSAKLHLKTGKLCAWQ